MCKAGSETVVGWHALMCQARVPMHAMLTGVGSQHGACDDAGASGSCSQTSMTLHLEHVVI